MSTAAIVLAGGSGSRLAHPDNKVFVPVGGRPLLAWSVRAFADAPSVRHLVVVARAGDHGRVAAVVDAERGTLPLRITTGGATRGASELAGLDALAAEIRDGTITVVLLHDAARPFASSRLIDGVATTAAAVGGGVAAMPLGDGVYRADDRGGLTGQPPDLFRVQTPQGFRAPELLAAYRRADRDGFAGIDTSATVRRYTRVAVAAVPGEATNIKVTFADDLAAAEAIAAARGPAPRDVPSTTRGRPRPR